MSRKSAYKQVLSIGTAVVLGFALFTGSLDGAPKLLSPQSDEQAAALAEKQNESPSRTDDEADLVARLESGTASSSDSQNSQNSGDGSESTATNTNGNVASTFVVFAMTDKSKGNHGISAFIVESTFPGFSTGKHEKKMGIRGSSTCDLVFEDCVVPKENLLGKEGEGFKIAMKTLDGGRIGIASQALGLAEGAINEAVKYTKERVQFGRRLSQFQNTQFQLADMHTRTQAAQYLVYAAAMKKQNHEDYSMDAAMAKLFAAETASDVTRRAVQLFGGYGYTREYPVERMMRDAKITEIYEGTSEVQRMVVAKYLGVN